MVIYPVIGIPILTLSINRLSQIHFLAVNAIYNASRNVIVSLSDEEVIYLNNPSCRTSTYVFETETVDEHSIEIPSDEEDI